MKKRSVKQWESLPDFFNTLNNSIDYLVLRNYEDFLNGNFNSNHPDIDFLCNDPYKFINVAKSISRTEDTNDIIHQKVIIANKEVDIDIRYVGDGYYDKKWENDMLSNRVLINNLCYVMDKENYFFSLLYHALIQKQSISEDYEHRLCLMAKSITTLAIEADLSLKTLKSFMSQRSYKFTYPIYVNGYVNFTGVERKMIKFDLGRIIKRKIYALKRMFYVYTKNK